MTAKRRELADRHTVASHDKGLTLIEFSHDLAALVPQLSLGDFPTHAAV
jgi:hypothetical protein